MECEFTKQFLKDIKSFQKDSKLVPLLGAKINQTLKANSISEVQGLQLIRGTSVHYRFKIKTDIFIYRVGIKKLKKVIWFTCIDNHKKRFYKRFP